MPSVDDQLTLLTRGLDQIEPTDGLRKKLEASAKSGKPLRVKYGIDPTGIDVHLGHTVPLRKLRQFQELGHQAVLIIGNYTALVGDPSGRDETRARLTQEQVEKNAQDYLKQISKILDMSKTEVRPNGDWFGKFTFLDVLSLTSKITVQRMLERDDFSKRFHSRPESIPIYLHECLYPLMQGHDSVEIHADIELGGSEQLFNLMMGRRLQDAAGQEPQICVTLPILRGLDGVRRMGKSLGNYVGVGESADQQFGKTLSIPDDLMKEWFTLLTDRPVSEIETLADSTKTHPMIAKKTLARDIVAFYYGADAATAAQANFEKQFGDKKDPDNILEREISLQIVRNGQINIVDLLVALKLAVSKSEARRLLGPNSGVTIGPNRTKIVEWTHSVEITDGLVIRIGSKRIVRIKLVA